MRTVMMVLVAVLIATTAHAADNAAPKKFKVSYTITYNELTLADAAKREDEIRLRYGADACRVDVAVDPVGLFTLSGSASVYTWPPQPTPTRILNY